MEVCKLPAREVAKIWIDSEHLYYRSVFDRGAITRLNAVIQRARDDGEKVGTPALWQWLLVMLIGFGIGFGACKLFF